MEIEQGANQLGANRLNVLCVRDYTTPEGEQRSAFTRLGVAFPLRNKPGFKVHLEAMPLNGELLLMPADDRKSEA